MKTSDIVLIHVTFLDMQVVDLSGPERLLSRWLVEPEVALTLPGVRIERHACSTPAPFRVDFLERRTRRLLWDAASSTIRVQGDLDSLLDKDIRRLVMHVAKVSVGLAGHVLIHASCVTNAKGEGILLCGNSGSGKSTLALYLSSRGYRIVSTDICLMDRSLMVRAGTRHVNIYPSLLMAWFPEYQAQVTTGTAQAGFSAKQLLPQDVLDEHTAFCERKQEVKVNRVLQLGVRCEGDGSYCEPMDDQEKLLFSVLLNEEWATSLWLCPSWQMFFPVLESDTVEAVRNETAMRLARLPHHALTGDLVYCAAQVCSLAESCDKS